MSLMNLQFFGYGVLFDGAALANIQVALKQSYCHNKSHNLQHNNARCDAFKHMRNRDKWINTCPEVQQHVMTTWQKNMAVKSQLVRKLPDLGNRCTGYVRAVETRQSGQTPEIVFVFRNQNKTLVPRPPGIPYTERHIPYPHGMKPCSLNHALSSTLTRCLWKCLYQFKHTLYITWIFQWIHMELEDKHFVISIGTFCWSLHGRWYAYTKKWNRLVLVCFTLHSGPSVHVYSSTRQQCVDHWSAAFMYRKDSLFFMRHYSQYNNTFIHI